jgi:hypothetical protein
LQALKIPLLAARVKITTEKCTGKGVYWRPLFHYEGEIDISQLKFFREIRQNYRENLDVTVREMKIEDDPDTFSNGHSGGAFSSQPLEATTFQPQPPINKPDDDLPF